MTKTRLVRFGSLWAGVFVWRSRASGLLDPGLLEPSASPRVIDRTGPEPGPPAVPAVSVTRCAWR